VYHIKHACLLLHLQQLWHSAQLVIRQQSPLCGVAEEDKASPLVQIMRIQHISPACCFAVDFLYRCSWLWRLEASFHDHARKCSDTLAMEAGVIMSYIQTSYPKNHIVRF